MNKLELKKEQSLPKVVNRKNHLIRKYGDEAVKIAEIAWVRFIGPIKDWAYSETRFEEMCWCGWAAIHKIQL